MAYFPAYTDRIDFWTIDGEMTCWVGVFLFAIGRALRPRPVFVLGGRFSGLVAIQPGSRLATAGIYSIAASYLGLVVSSLGVLLTILPIAPVVPRMRAEERLLRTQLGIEHDADRARTSRFIPGLY